MEELSSKYQVPRKVAKEWVEAEQVLPLLDGLDEVAPASRTACIETINRYRQEHGFLPLVDLAASGGRIVSYGATNDNPPQMPQRKIFWRQLSVLGTTMGSRQDFEAMLNFVNLHRLLPVVSATFPLERAAEAFALMEQGGQFGKIVLTMPRHGPET